MSTIRSTSKIRRKVVDGSITIAEFNTEMDANLSDEWGETIGGLLLHHYGELPPEGARIEFDRFVFTIVEIDENRIKTVEFEKLEIEPGIQTATPASPEAGSPGPGSDSQPE